MALPSLRGGNSTIPTLDGAVAPVAPAAMAIPPLNTDGAETLNGLADRIGRIVDAHQQRHDREAVAAAKTAGAAAGDAAPGSTMEGGGALYRDAFNRQAAETGGRRLEITARTQLDELAQKHADDPAAFNEAAQRYRAGLIGALPPAMAPRLGQAFDTMARPYTNQLEENHRRAVASQNVGTFNEALPGRIAAIERLAPQALRDPAAAAALAQEEGGLRADLAAMGPRGAFSFGGQNFPADPTRSGALRADQVAEQWLAVQQRRTEATVLGAWRASGGSERWIDEWARRERGTGAPPAAGAGSNGRMDPAQLVPIDANHRLAAPAAAAYQAMVAAAATDGVRFAPTDSYRSLDQQVQVAREKGLYSQGGLAAVPGTSRHGEGMAVDLGPAPGGSSGPNDANSPEHRWLQANAGRFGFATIPREPWHWEYRAESGNPDHAPSGLPAQEIRRIEGQLRGEFAHNQAGLRERQSAAWGSLAGQVQANQSAVALTGREQQPITNDQLRAAGRTPQQIQQYRNGITFGAATFEATNTLAMATPGQIEAFRPRLLPGGDLFNLHPEGAVRLVGAIDTRAGHIAASGVEARVADLRAQAAQAGTDGRPAPQLAPDEAAALRLPPERVAAINHDLETQAAAHRLVAQAALAPPSDAQAVPASLSMTGQDAAESALIARAWHQAWQGRTASIAASPGNHVLNHDAPTRDAWNAAQQDLTRIGPAIAMTLGLQDYIGVPASRQQAVPPVVATALAQSISQMPTTAERLDKLQKFLAQVPEEHRAQLNTALGKAGLPDGLRIGAAAAPRVGPLMASRLASELAVDVSKLHLVPSLAASVRAEATSVFDSSDRLGGLRAAQAQATGNAAFLEIAARERDMLERVAKVRAAPSGSSSTSAVQAAYGQMFGGNQVVNETGFLLTVPATMDASQVQRGLGYILAARLEGAAPAQRQAALRGSWVDAGADRFVFYPLGSPTPLAGRDGAPLTASPGDALAAPPASAAAARQPLDAARRRDLARRTTGAPLPSIPLPPAPTQ